MKQIGIWVNEASIDLNRCLGFAPDKMLYHKSVRTHVSDHGSKSLFPEAHASSYVAQTRSVSNGIVDREDSRIAELAPFASEPTPMRDVNPVTLGSVVGAMRRSEAIKARYKSLSRPLPRLHELAPQANVLVYYLKNGIV